MKNYTKSRQIFWRFPGTALKAKLTTFLLLVSLFQVQANTYAQRTKLNLDLENVSIKEVFDEIENVSEFRFLFETGQIELDRQVSIKVRETKIADVLPLLFDGTDVDYKIRGRQVILKKRGFGPSSPRGDTIDDSVSATNSDLQQQVTGTVTDTDGVPLAGANIVEKGTTNGTQTDFDGNYSIDVADGAVLVVSYIGFATKEVAVDSQSNIVVSLSEDAAGLDEVVVVGYGGVRKSDLTGAVLSLQDDDLNQGLNTSIDQKLQGRAPGVQITQSSSEPGGSVSIRIRGSSSVNAGNEPLYVIDGLPIDNTPTVNTTAGFNGSPPARNPLAALNPSDIESIEILKDASAAAIYGARGANGVVLITTKSGKGKLKITYNTSLSVSEITRKVDVLNTREYLDVTNELEIARGNGPLFSDADIQRYGSGTDWQDQVLRSAVAQKHDLSFAGGDEKTSFYASLNYTDQEGIVVTSNFERYQGRVNLEHRANDRFRFGINLNTSNVVNDYVSTNSAGINQNADLINSALNTPPIFPVYNADGSFFRPEEGQQVSVTLDNPVARAVGESITEETNRTFGTIFAEYEVLPDLRAKVNFGSDRTSSRRDIYNSTQTALGSFVNGSAVVQSGESKNYLVELTLNYKKLFNEKHDLTLLAGTTYQEFQDRNQFSSAQGFSSDVIRTNNLGVGDRMTFEVGTNRNNRKLLSYLGRANYSFDNRYLATATVRADGSSNFGENNRFGVFPSFSLAWKINQEEFLREEELFSELKLRAGWGQIGNDNIGIGNSLLTFSGAGNAIFGDAVFQGVAPARIPNPDLKWETTEQLNIGLDFGLFSGRVSSSLDYYIKSTKDLLLALPIPTATGFGSITSNVGEIRNRGFEFLLRTKNLVGDFKWDTSFNFATLDNEVIDLGPLNEIVTGNFGATALVRPGEPLFSYYGLESEGIFQTQEEVDNSAQAATAAPGVPRWRDVNDDGTINGEDRVVLGNAFPDVTFGLSNDFSYKNLSLNVFFEAAQGVDLLYWGLVDALIANDPFRNRLAEPLLNRWTPDNPTDTWPSAINTAQYQGGNVNSFTIADASFVRLKNVQLNYAIPIDSKYVNSVSVFLSGQNLALFTDYPGYDPDVNSTGTGNIRLDRNAYPASRTFTLGLNVEF